MARQRKNASSPPESGGTKGSLPALHSSSAPSRATANAAPRSAERAAEDAILAQHEKDNNRKMPLPFRLFMFGLIASICIDHVWPWQVLLKIG